MTDNIENLPNAGLIRRLMAIVYDSLLLLGVAFAYGIVIWVIRKAVGDDPMTPLTGIAAVLQLFFLWVTLSGYYVLCWITRGQTLGMKSWRLKLVTKNGKLIDQYTGWLRCVLAVASAVPAGLGYIWCLFGNKHCWHDLLVDCRVVVLPKHSKSRHKEARDNKDSSSPSEQSQADK